MGRVPANSHALAQHDVQFLTEIGDLKPENNVFLIRTGNHAENIDPRVLRGGRFSEKIQIPSLTQTSESGCPAFISKVLASRRD